MKIITGIGTGWYREQAFHNFLQTQPEINDAGLPSPYKTFRKDLTVSFKELTAPSLPTFLNTTELSEGGTKIWDQGYQIILNDTVVEFPEHVGTESLIEGSHNTFNTKSIAMIALRDLVKTKPDVYFLKVVKVLRNQNPLLLKAEPGNGTKGEWEFSATFDID